LAVLLAISAAGCGSSGDGQSASPSIATVTVKHAEAEQSPTSDAPTPSDEPPASVTQGTSQNGQSSGGGDTFEMPNEVGNNLQAAQDDIQAVSGNPFYYSSSKDATGQSRFQILDAGWQVCSQKPAPGAIVQQGADVIFSVVRVTETCP
jgi:hypothetical protein